MGGGWVPTHYQVKHQLMLRLSWAVTTGLPGTPKRGREGEGPDGRTVRGRTESDMHPDIGTKLHGWDGTTAVLRMWWNKMLCSVI